MDKRIEKYFHGDLETSEKLNLLKSIASDDMLKAEFIEYKNMLGLVSLYDRKDGRKQRKPQTRTLFVRLTATAAAVALLVMGTYWITAKTTRNRLLAEEQFQTVYVPAGQHIRLTLQDGTNVWLNAQTTLTYPVVFAGNERRVRIEGEGFFEIAPVPQKPFIVSAQHVEMEALGTQFNVYSSSQEHLVQTSLTEGKLHVYFPQAKEQGVTLKPNEEVVIRSNKMQVGLIPHLDYFWWKKGIYSFHNEVLSNVLSKLEMYYDVDIIVEAPSINEYTYTGKFRHRDGIDEILQLICKIHQFTIEKDEENNVFVLK
ncbi:MAG: DUF4974 domain-containing protein [Tannerellaceae bacterium]|jgi:ferric-dicitrate binding protein FerR (iron transport regulator)|nr:DUF4974 domain-containing protein [Tannerellaceae bacterium]